MKIKTIRKNKIFFITLNSYKREGLDIYNVKKLSESILKELRKDFEILIDLEKAFNPNRNIVYVSIMKDIKRIVRNMRHTQKKQIDFQLYCPETEITTLPNFYDKYIVTDIFCLINEYLKIYQKIVLKSDFLNDEIYIVLRDISLKIKKQIKLKNG